MLKILILRKLSWERACMRRTVPFVMGMMVRAGLERRWQRIGRPSDRM
jgi:hypothetical protein